MGERAQRRLIASDKARQIHSRIMIIFFEAAIISLSQLRIMSPQKKTVTRGQPLCNLAKSPPADGRDGFQKLETALKGADRPDEIYRLIAHARRDGDLVAGRFD
jgi:hypothetical protein